MKPRILFGCALFLCFLQLCLCEIALFKRNESRKPFVDEITDPAQIKADGDFQPKIEFAEDINNYEPRAALPQAPNDIEGNKYEGEESEESLEDDHDEESTSEEITKEQRSREEQEERYYSYKKPELEVNEQQVVKNGHNAHADQNAIDEGSGRPLNETVSVISSAFSNRKTFACPRIKSDFVTGTSIANLSPEDIGIIAAMGDSLAAGKGLWPQTDIEFRGAAFPIGGDATIDGLVTVPNILKLRLHSL